MSLIFTFGLYHLLYALSDANIVKRAIKGVGRTTHLERKGIFLILQKIADKI
jgi:hypothetical protein